MITQSDIDALAQSQTSKTSSDMNNDIIAQNRSKQSGNKQDEDFNFYQETTYELQIKDKLQGQYKVYPAYGNTHIIHNILKGLKHIDIDGNTLNQIEFSHQAGSIVSEQAVLASENVLIIFHKAKTKQQSYIGVYNLVTYQKNAFAFILQQQTSQQYFRPKTEIYLYFYQQSQMLCVCQMLFEYKVQVKLKISYFKYPLIPVKIKRTFVNPVNPNRNGFGLCPYQKYQKVFQQENQWWLEQDCEKSAQIKMSPNKFRICLVKLDDKSAIGWHNSVSYILKNQSAYKNQEQQKYLKIEGIQLMEFIKNKGIYAQRNITNQLLIKISKNLFISELHKIFEQSMFCKPTIKNTKMDIQQILQNVDIIIEQIYKSKSDQFYGKLRIVEKQGRKQKLKNPQQQCVQNQKCVFKNSLIDTNQIIFIGKQSMKSNKSNNPKTHIFDKLTVANFRIQDHRFNVQFVHSFVPNSLISQIKNANTSQIENNNLTNQNLPTIYIYVGEHHNQFVKRVAPQRQSVNMKLINTVFKSTEKYSYYRLSDSKQKYKKQLKIIKIKLKNFAQFPQKIVFILRQFVPDCDQDLLYAINELLFPKIGNQTVPIPKKSELYDN